MKSSATEIQQPSTSPEPRNFLVTFLLACSFGPLGLRHFYLGDQKLGWTRTGLFAGGYAWIFLMGALNQAALMFLGLIAVMIAAVWAIVDFFYVYNVVRTDIDGKSLAITARDKKWAKAIYIAAVIAAIASILFMIFGLSLAENSFRDFIQNSPYDQRGLDGADSYYQTPYQAN